MAIPHAVLAAGWVPFSVVLLLIAIFSYLYIRYYQCKYDSEKCSTFASVCGLAVTLVTCALVPVDVFLVSFMKDTDGTFKEWAKNNETRNSVENGILYAYYGVYLLVVLFMFFILPFSYFFYEECDEHTSNGKRICTAVKYSLVFMIFAIVVIFIGAFVPFKTMDHFNGTDWDALQNLFKEFGNDHGKNAISFTGSFLALIGMLLVAIYTAMGMTAWPMDLIKGKQNVAGQMSEVEMEREETQTLIKELKDKYPDGRNMTSRDQEKLEDLEEEERVILRRINHLEAMKKSCIAKCTRLFRPCQIVFGVFFLLLAVLIFMSLLLNSIDKAMYSAGPHTGYALAKRHIPNPVDLLLIYSQQVFPMDYIIFGILIMYFFLCSMGGMRRIGIWFCWIKMFKIRPRKTKPQGLLFLCFLLMFIVLALNVLLIQITPQYVTYGSQHYIAVENVTLGTQVLLPCSMSAPADDCVMTRTAMLLARFFYKFWFFGAAYYWISWVFLAIFLIGFVISIFTKPRSAIEDEVDQDDFDSDEELLPA